MKSAAVFTSQGLLNTKKQRQSQICKENLSSIPASYKLNTIKEELCLEYIYSFLSQFQISYPSRKAPFLIAENEYGVKKFVCSTLRPTQMNIAELYDLYECASFISGYIQYEPLDPPFEPPQYLFSPHRVLESYTGDCFDMSMLLTSLLIGAGYDAYVVHGYAPQYITLKDQSKTECPLTHIQNETDMEKSNLMDEIRIDSFEAIKSIGGEYHIPDNRVQGSNFVKKLKDQEELSKVDTFQLWHPDVSKEEELLIKEQQELTLSNAAAAAAASPFANINKKNSKVNPILNFSASSLLPVHSWVMVRPERRDVKEVLFIEPTTGRVFTPASCPYIAIEAVWNQSNYFIHTDITRKISEINFNLSQSQYWESLFFSSNSPSGNNNNINDEELKLEENDDDYLLSLDENKNNNNTLNSNNGNANGSNGNNDGNNKVYNKINHVRFFDAPSRWSLPLSLTRKQFLLKYPPNGVKTVQYYSTKVDYYARGANNQCMVMRITNYIDHSCIMVKNIHEFFEYRIDKLYKRSRYFLGKNRSIVEYYQPGNKYEIKKWKEYPGKQIEIDYYVEGRLDHLVRRVEKINEKIEEYFVNRSDFMNYRCLDISTRPPTFIKNVAVPSTANNNNVTTPGGNGLLSPINPNSSGAPATPAPQSTAPTTIAARTQKIAETQWRNELHVTRLELRYDEDPSLPKGKSIAKKIFYVPEAKAVYTYHFGPNQIQGEVKTIIYMVGDSIIPNSEASNTQEINVISDTNVINEVFGHERDIFHAIRANEKYHQQLLAYILDVELQQKNSYQQNQANAPTIFSNNSNNPQQKYLVVPRDPSVFDIALDNIDLNGDNYDNNKNNNNNNNNNSNNQEHDYLSPYLRHIKDISNITLEEAIDIREKCLNAYRQRMAERANIIQSKLAEENMKLGKKQESFQRSQREGENSTENYEKFCTDAMFKIQILEQRYQTHKDTSSKKIKDLEEKINNDPRLKVLKS